MNATDPLAAAGLRPHVEITTKMRESADITKIAPALVRAQAEMMNPPRNRAVQVRSQGGASYTFKYTTLDKITEMIRPALAENGLCILQPIVTTDRGAILLTRLLHESGQWMECEVTLPPVGNNPQSFGSAVTYLKRYSLVAFLNITSDEDNDGNTAAGNHVADAARGKRQERARGAVDALSEPPPEPPPPAPSDTSEPESPEVWSPWVILSREGTPDDFETAERWVGGWKFRLGKVAGATKKGPAEKRATLAAMGKANANVFAALAEAGNGARVQEVTEACAALDATLAEQERATAGAPV